jgi:hypothetical protein
MRAFAAPQALGRLPRVVAVELVMIVGFATAGAELTNPPVRLVRPGLFEIGQVRLDEQQRSVSFPAALNLNQGPMEYLLVTVSGKTHESILRTEAEPYHIHTAMLLLGAATNTLLKKTGPPAVPGRISSNPTFQPFFRPSNDTIPGDKISIEVTWSEGGKEIQRSAEELVLNQETQRPLGRGNWIYNGSTVVQGVFLAQMDGSIVSLITDSAALANQTGPGRDNDKIWTVNTNRLPPFETPLTVTLRLEQNPPSPKKE